MNFYNRKTLTRHAKVWRYPQTGSLADRVGFEPTVRFHVHTLSKRAP